MKIWIATLPDYVCADKEHHADLFKGVFVGMEFPSAKSAPGEDGDYLVTIKDVLLAIMKKQGPLSVEGVYWQTRWARHMLSDYVRFPRSCCRVR